MLALSIRQPWTWLILHAGKDVENRDWPTRVRGRILLHAGKALDVDATRDVFSGVNPATNDLLRFDVKPFEMETPTRFDVGGIIGEVEIVDCVDESESPWFFGRYGFVLRNPKPLPFVPYKGRLGFFEVAL